MEEEWEDGRERGRKEVRNVGWFVWIGSFWVGSNYCGVILVKLYLINNVFSKIIYCLCSKVTHHFFFIFSIAWNMALVVPVYSTKRDNIFDILPVANV